MILGRGRETTLMSIWHGLLDILFAKGRMEGELDPIIKKNTKAKFFLPLKNMLIINKLQFKLYYLNYFLRTYEN